ncbi:hypothetical protein P7C71_g542, partial [Lecanoromycetidae sp. Uapishka_2]
MPFFMNPLQKHDVSDFPDVYVPLAHSDARPSVVANRPAKIEASSKSSADGSDHSSNENDCAFTIEDLKEEIDQDIAASGIDTAYDRKSKVINKAITDIGMGRYQWQLFALCGFGWLADNLVLQVVALTLPSLTSEFGPSSTQVRYTTCSLFVGLCVGASFWGIASDIIGRQLAFNATLLIAGIFGLAVGKTPVDIEGASTDRMEAYKNGRKTWLSEEVLNLVGGDPELVDNENFSTGEIVQRIFSKFSKDRIAPLFATRRLGLMTALVWFCWATIGMGYPLFNSFLPQYLQNAGKDTPPTPNNIVYRNYAITSIVGVPGSIIAAYTVNVEFIGRKGALIIAAFLAMCCFPIETRGKASL